ncbi:Golgi integral membrane protein 4-like [Acipenser oxyrinchus oxyrinchus]|uniref:Golgi integral membrane protein 4-like n=1 Tax=Acipenser oxyrinchus oxyrinchus TaxID=40147 RepID=A0AAD8DGZ6_ACIOX|nr:Golgi integral membrane protein 4-like [Acipenser oxyrinchus oxyrinchus]
MGNGMFSRRHKRIFQSLVLLTVIFGLLYGAMMSYEMHKQLKRTEAIAVKYQQHQESLSAQLQVVYEHRSRLEKSLQKERLEHKKAKEDFLVYKLEAQQSLNKDKQDSTSRFNSLNVQHEMLKNQHDELKKRYYGLHEEHQLLREDHNSALTEHKDKYDNLQQEKEIEISKLKENIYNLHEENKHIRKAHQDVHAQLQDVKKQHTDLKFEHEQLALTLDDHKSALAAAQAQVDMFKQFKETLKKMPSFRQPALHTPVPEEPRKQAEDDQTQYKIHTGGQQPVGNFDGLQQEVPNIGAEHEQRDHTHPSEHIVHREENRDRRREGLQVQPVEEDHRKELAEEEMEQAGLPEHLDEESDQPQEEEEKEVHQKEEQPPAHAEQEEAGVIHEDRKETAKEHGGSQQRLKSAYEEQQDQQRLVSQREEEARQLKERQESLHRQRLDEQMDRQQQLRDRELQLQREADHKEEILRRQQQQQLRQQPEYENIDADIVQGGEEQDIQKQDDGHEHPHVEEGGHEQQDEDPEEEHAKKDANPQEDPNNRGEDEFEEAEKEKHNNLPDGNAEHKKHLENMAKPEVDEQLVMAGNPDQQEDTLNEQYQEEGEEEVHDDLAEGPKVQQEENEEAYNEENEERGNIKDPEGPEKEEDSPPGDHLKPESEVIEEENYEEEVEEEEAPGNPNRRAEM